MAWIACATAAWAQPADQAAALSADQMLADAMAQHARAAMSGPTAPTPAMVTRATVLLEQSLELDPNRPERWRLLAEAREAAEDQAGLIQTLKRYMQLRPDDDVAKLRLVDLLAERQQTAQRRLAYYKRIVSGRASKHFGAALRSRVAFRAAQLHWEQGRDNAQARLLAEAISLDPTNKQAAAASLARIADDPNAGLSEHGAALFTLFHADPVDLSTHLTIADMLMSQGLYETALDWYESADALRQADRRPPSLTLLHSRAMALWGMGEDGEALRLLNRITPTAEDQAKDATRNTPAATTPAGSPGERRPPQPDWPPLDTLMLEAAIRGWAGADDQAARAYNRLVDRLQSMAGDAPNDPGPLTTLLWARVICDRDLDAAEQELTRLRRRAGAEPVVAEMLEGWLAARAGRTPRATERLEPHADTDPRAGLGLALALAADGRTDAAVEHLRRANHAAPDELFGLLAASRLRRIGQPPTPRDNAEPLDELFNRIPDRLQYMADEPLRVVQVHGEPMSQRISYGQPLPIVLELRNTSDRTLSLGPDGTIPTRMVLASSVRAMDIPTPPAPPLVVDMHRRLRLAPRSELQVRMRLDSGPMGMLMQQLSWPRLQIGCLGILNAQLRRSGRFSAGALGSSFRMPSMVRRNTPTTDESIDALLAQTVDADPAGAMRARALLMNLARWLGSQGRQDKAARIAGQLNNQFADLPPPAQAWSVAFTGPSMITRPGGPNNPGGTNRTGGRRVRRGEAEARHADLNAELFAPMRQAAAASTDHHVRLMLLATLQDPNSPHLNAALRRSEGSETVKTFARATRQALQEAAAQRAEAERRRREREQSNAPSPTPPDGPAPDGRSGRPTRPPSRAQRRRAPAPFPAESRTEPNDRPAGAPGNPGGPGSDLGRRRIVE